MKKIVLILSIAVLAAACENTIKYEYDKNDGELTLLAQMSTSDTQHSIYLAWSYPDRVETVEGASVTCTINGVKHITTEVVITPPEENVYYFQPRYTEYKFSGRFKAGDEVVVEASKGNKKASATFTVPPAPILSKVDTASVVKTVHYSDLFDSEANDYVFLEVAAQIRDLQGEDNYYVMNCNNNTYAVNQWLDDDGKLIQENKMENHIQVRYETFGDHILEDGYATQAGSLLADLLPTNVWHGFSDKQFTDKDAEVKFYIDEYYTGPGHYRWALPYDSSASNLHIESFLEVKLGSITRDFYNYLRALNNLSTYGYDVSVIIEPTMIPSNVVGGYGLVTVISEAVVTLKIVDEYYDTGVPYDPYYYGPE